MLRLLTLILALAAAPLAAETRVPTSQAEISLGFAPLVKQAAPAVVNIYAKRVVQSRSPFASVTTLVDYIEMLINESTN